MSLPAKLTTSRVLSLVDSLLQGLSTSLLLDYMTAASFSTFPLSPGCHGHTPINIHQTLMHTLLKWIGAEKKIILFARLIGKGLSINGHGQLEPMQKINIEKTLLIGKQLFICLKLNMKNFFFIDGHKTTFFPASFFLFLSKGDCLHPCHTIILDEGLVWIIRGAP